LLVGERAPQARDTAEKEWKQKNDTLLAHEKLVEELRPTRSLAYNPLVQVAFVPQETPFDGFSLGDVTVAPLPPSCLRNSQRTRRV